MLLRFFGLQIAAFRGERNRVLSGEPEGEPGTALSGGQIGQGGDFDGSGSPFEFVDGGGLNSSGLSLSFTSLGDPALVLNPAMRDGNTGTVLGHARSTCSAQSRSNSNETTTQAGKRRLMPALSIG